eukprot:SAG31_NODE_73_length_27793_cov_26.900520_16_plen_219_part_00
MARTSCINRGSRSPSPAQPAGEQGGGGRVAVEGGGGRVAIPVEPLMDIDELPFDLQDIGDKIYIMRGTQAQICLEWQDLDAAIFLKKQGYDNAKKFTRKRQEPTISFLNRAVKFQTETASPEGTPGDIFKIVHNNKLLRATVYFTLMVLFVQMLMFIIYYVYDAAGCNIWYNLWTPFCSVLDKTKAFLRDHTMDVTYLWIGVLIGLITNLVYYLAKMI